MMMNFMLRGVARFPKKDEPNHLRTTQGVGKEWLSHTHTHTHTKKFPIWIVYEPKNAPKKKKPLSKQKNEN